MNNLNLKVRYIFHSGFSVETDKTMLIFDYYRGKAVLPENKRIFVFSSHNHQDHFNPAILDWRSERPDINYILSSDIELGQSDANIRFMSPYEQLELDDLKIRTYGSTDQGVSFMVSCEGRNIFHAGDLNWWYWWDDTPEEIEKAEKAYKDEISRMMGETVNVAFFPIDPRLEQNYSAGAEYFIQKIKPTYLVPMHYTGDYKTAARFAEKMTGTYENVVLFSKKGEDRYL